MAGNNQQTVLVKLTAEGEEQVVEAFKKMSEGAKHHAEEAEGALNTLKEAAGELGKTLVGLFALERVADGFKEMVAGAIETGDALMNLHTQTGISTDNLQAYSYAAKMADVSQESLNQGMTRLARSIYQAQQGSKGATDALNELHISVKELQGLTPDEQFNKVAKAIGEMTDKTHQQAVAQALMGRGGAELTRVFKDVAENGVGSYVEKLKELGVYMDEDAIKSMAAMDESMKNLKTEVQGLGTQFATGLVPDVTNAMEAIMKSTTGPGVDGFKKLGHVVGNVIKGIVTGFEFAGIVIGNFAGLLIENTKNLIDSVGTMMHDFSNGQWGAGVDAWKAGSAQRKANQQAAAQSTNSALDDIMKSLWGDEKKEGGIGGGGSGLTGLDPNNSQAVKTAAAISRARLQLTEQMLTNELQLYKANAALLERQEKDAYDAGKMSLAQYYDDRAQIIRATAEEEAKILRERIAAEEKLTIDKNDPAAALKKQTEELKLQGELKRVELDRDNQLYALTEQRRQAEEKLYNDRVKAEMALAKIRGDNTGAERLALEKQLRDLERMLKAGGTSDADTASAVGTARDQGEAAIDFKDKLEQAKQAAKDLQQEIAKIKQMEAAGDLYPIQAAEMIAQKERERLPSLQKISKELSDIAAKTKDPALIQQAEEFKIKTGEVATEIKKTEDATIQWRASLQNAVAQGLDNLFTKGVSGAKNLQGAFKSMALSIVDDLQKIAAKALEQQILKSIFGGASAGGSGGGSGAGFIGMIGSLFMADGGHVPGAGNGDTVPAMLTPGEFVVKQDVMSRPGMAAFMEALNGSGVRGMPGPAGVAHYASGGFVSQSSAAPQIKMINVLDPTTLGDHLATAAGEQAVMNVISRNPNKVRDAIG